jgi:hypothetical protein
MKQISLFHYYSFEDSLVFGLSTTSIKGIHTILREMIDHSVSYYSLRVSMLDPNQLNPNNRLRAELEATGLISPPSDASPPRIERIVSPKRKSETDKLVELEPIFGYFLHFMTGGGNSNEIINGDPDWMHQIQKRNDLNSEFLKSRGITRSEPLAADKS